MAKGCPLCADGWPVVVYVSKGPDELYHCLPEPGGNWRCFDDPMLQTDGWQPWHRWFAWRPVRLREGGWAWGQTIWHRRFVHEVIWCAAPDDIHEYAREPSDGQ